MAEPETTNHEEPTFPTKRKLDQEEDIPNKIPKTTPTTIDHNHAQDSEIPTTTTTTNSPSKPDAVTNIEYGGNDDNGNNADDDDEDDEDDEEEDSDREPVVDRKGKGIMRDDKGKGKLIEEEDEEDEDSDDDSDDSDDDSDGNVSGSESDFSDDPLAEVDLNNILPSRTRRRTAQPGLHISGGTPNAD